MRYQKDILVFIGSILLYLATCLLCKYFNITGDRFHNKGNFFSVVPSTAFYDENHKQDSVQDSVAFIIPVAPKHFRIVKEFLPYFEKKSSNIQLLLVFTNDLEQKSFRYKFGKYRSIRYVVLDPKFAINGGIFRIK